MPLNLIHLHPDGDEQYLLSPSCST